jgi:hypothetical protein
MKSFVLDVSYSQVAVFIADLPQPHNEWANGHMAQGFAWRPGSVSFQTLEDGGNVLVCVKQLLRHEMRSDSVRAIAVPFRVMENAAIEIASISDSKMYSIESGDYCLIFEHGLGSDGQMWIEFTFLPTEGQANPKILRADNRLAPSDQLLMMADPA